MNQDLVNQSLTRKINFLTGYAVFSVLIIAFFVMSSFDEKDAIEQFDELTVKKITVIGEDNLPRMVLSNENRQHSGRMNGKEWEKRERPSGIIFFNNDGDECGGLVFQTKEKDGEVISGMSFTMDNYKDDQVIQLLNDEYYVDGKAYIKRGLSINEYPVGSNVDERNAKLKELRKIEDKKEQRAKIKELMKKEGSVNRMFIGKTKGNSSGIFLAAPDGSPKIMIYVDDKGVPKFQTFSENGEMTDLLENE